MIEKKVSDDELEPREYDPNVLTFRRYRPLSKMVDDMVKDTGITHTDATKVLVYFLEKLIEWSD